MRRRTGERLNIFQILIAKTAQSNHVWGAKLARKFKKIEKIRPF
jgi:hypothetical protein